MREPPGPHDPGRTVIPAFIDAAPSFAEPWRVHVADWPGDDRGVYIDAGRFAQHLVELVERSETSELRAVFDTFERLWAEGDDDVRYLLKVGLLETLGNFASNTHGWAWAAQIRAWFGPAASGAWDELHEEWGTSDSG